LTAADLRRFAADGYLVVSGVVDDALLDAADDEVTQVTRQIDPTEGDRGPGPNLWFPPRGRVPRCDDLLFGSPALAIARQLVAPQALSLAFDHIQIATTIPPWPHEPGGPHIDGHGPGQDPPASFTMLAGVFLTDQLAPRSGSLWVWPGSHLDHVRLFLDRGTRILEETGGHPTLLDPAPPLDEPVQVGAARGDLLLAHYLLGHNKGAHIGATERRTAYFRLSVPGHRDR
jgi:hypothetical protein